MAFVTDGITTTDILVGCNILTMIVSFVTLFSKISARISSHVSRLDQKLNAYGNRIVKIETNQFHIMRKLDMMDRVDPEPDSIFLKEPDDEQEQ